MTDEPKAPVEIKKKDGVNETIKTVIYAILIALVVRTFTYQPYNIPSGSMIPTLLVGDYLFASKFSYGYSQYSFPVDLPLFRGRILSSPPARGDVVIFKYPGDNSTDYIKRVIGLPGDRIQVTHGQLYLNDKAVPREPMPDYIETNSEGDQRQERRFMETLPDGPKHEIIQVGDDNRLDNTDVFIVPPDHYFLMGDNRTNSSDSRAFGYVPFENFEAKADVIFFSLNQDAHFWEIWKWPEDLRISRIFQSIT
jgi:signal peptidase I